MARKSLLERGWLWVPPLVYMMLIFHLSSESNPLPVLTEHVWDKALHFVEYGVLGVLFFRALAGEGLGAIAAFALAVLLTSAYGASDEWHQLFTPDRSSDVHDWLADTTGGAVGMLIYSAMRGGGLGREGKPPVSRLSRPRRQPRR